MAQILVELIGFMAVLALAGAIGVIGFGDRAFAARVSARAGAGQVERHASGAFAGFQSWLLKLLARWGQTAGRGAIEKDKRAEVRLKLIQAGFYSDRAVETLFGIRAVAAVAFAVLAILAARLLHYQSALALLCGLMGGANLGLFLPNFLLEQRIRRRRKAMQLGLPDAIDLMVVSVEAGATLSAALQRVVAEFGDLHPVLVEQFGLLMMEMQAGASRAEALTRLAQRTGSDEVRTLTTMLIQSDAVGASLGATLRVLSDELRRNRFLEAEGRAAALPVKLSFPLVLCIFPALIGVIFIPTAIRVLHTMAQLHQ